MSTLLMIRPLLMALLLATTGGDADDKRLIRGEVLSITYIRTVEKTLFYSADVELPKGKKIKINFILNPGKNMKVPDLILSKGEIFKAYIQRQKQGWTLVPSEGKHTLRPGTGVLPTPYWPPRLFWFIFGPIVMLMIVATFILGRRRSRATKMMELYDEEMEKSGDATTSD